MKLFYFLPTLILARTFQLSGNSNAACFKNPGTIELNSDAYIAPVVVFNYDDLNATGLPNLDIFLKENSTMGDLNTLGDVTYITENSSLKNSPGTYCIYLTSVSNQQINVKLEHYTTDYVTLQVVIILITMLAFMFTVGNKSKIDRLLGYTCAFNFLFYATLLALEWRNSDSTYFRHMEPWVESIQQFAFLMIYAGYGSNYEPKYILPGYVLFIWVIYFATLGAAKSVTVEINHDIFEILYNSVIVKGGHESGNSYLRLVNGISQFGLFAFTFYNGALALREKTFKMKLATSFVVHLVLFKALTKPFLAYLNSGISFEGTVDVAQGLDLIGHVLLGNKFLYGYLVNLGELFLVWVVWCRLRLHSEVEKKNV